MELIKRPRRLRGSANLRKMVRETRMDKSSLIYPLFVLEGNGIQEEIPSMEGQYRYSLDRLPYKLEQLEKVSKGQIKREIQKSTFVSSQTTDNMHEKKINFKQEIDVRGMRGDEALQSVTYFIDDAIQVGAGKVRILHGTGTGILRQLIRDYLRTVPGVRRFQDEHVQFGGAGITVVEFD